MTSTCRPARLMSRRLPGQPDSMLDALPECDCIARMKTKIFAVILGAAVLATGCVNTVTGGKTAGVPLVKDTIQSNYERQSDQVYQAAKEGIQYNGTLVHEGTLHGQTNAVNNIVRTVEGKVNQRSVWIRVAQVD